jgi:hypothetical protein
MDWKAGVWLPLFFLWDQRAPFDACLNQYMLEARATCAILVQRNPFRKTIYEERRKARPIASASE